MVITSRAPVPRLRRSMGGGTVTGGGRPSLDRTEEGAGVPVAEATVWRVDGVADAGTRRVSQVAEPTEEASRDETTELPLAHSPTRKGTRRELLVERLETARVATVGSRSSNGRRQAGVTERASVTREETGGRGGHGGLGRPKLREGAAEAGPEVWRSDQAAAEFGTRAPRRELAVEEAITGSVQAAGDEERHGGRGRRRGAVEADDELRLELVR